jgi:hypothetical protein
MSFVGATLAGGRSITVSDEAIGWTFFLTSDGTWITLDVLSAGLDAGYAIGLLFVFFALQYPRNGTIGLNTIQNWWGNTVYTKTADFKGVPLKSLPDSGKFGPSSW